MKKYKLRITLEDFQATLSYDEFIPYNILRKLHDYFLSFGICRPRYLIYVEVMEEDKYLILEEAWHNIRTKEKDEYLTVIYKSRDVAYTYFKGDGFIQYEAWKQGKYKSKLISEIPYAIRKYFLYEML